MKGFSSTKYNAEDFYRFSSELYGTYLDRTFLDSNWTLKFRDGALNRRRERGGDNYFKKSFGLGGTHRNALGRNETITDSQGLAWSIFAYLPKVTKRIT
jgi:hypothetical protein